MHIKPIIQGVVARSAHPYGCEQAVLQQNPVRKTGESDQVRSKTRSDPRSIVGIWARGKDCADLWWRASRYDWGLL